jgi:hypothetical protein
MAIDYRIDHTRGIVFAQVRGSLTAQEMLAYQNEVWSNPAVASYDELVDMSEVEQIVGPTATGVADLAETCGRMDSPTSRSRFAIVAPGNLAFGLGRMYATFRELVPGSTKQVAVFRTMEPALAWLEVKEPSGAPDGNAPATD